MACSSYKSFCLTAAQIWYKRIEQGWARESLKTYGRYTDLRINYEVYLSQSLHDSIGVWVNTLTPSIDATFPKLETMEPEWTLRLLRGVGRWARKPVNHTSWVAVVTPTDRPKSVRNCCLIELFVALFVLLLCPFDISVGIGAFVIGLGQISSFLSLLPTLTLL